MSYSISSPRQLVYFSNAWCDATSLINLLTAVQADQFQTQNARTTVQQQLGDMWSGRVGPTERFPETGFYVFRFDPILEQLITALMNSFDTRNRIIEVENQPAPNTTEMVNATQRVDDATVNIRSCITNLLNPLVQGTGMYNRSVFESASGLVWTAASTSTN